MTRKAILIINTAKSDSANTSVDLRRAKQAAGQISALLGALGEYSFDVDSLVDLRYEAAERSVSTLLSDYSRKSSKDDIDCLLIYYFGHAVDRTNGLNFVFKNSDVKLSATLMHFDWLTNKALGYGISKVLFILDCCYAGAAQRNFQRSLNATDTRYAVMCSAIPTQMANVQKGKSPFGLFSNFLFDGLKDPNSSEADSDNVTVKSLFDYTNRCLSDKEMLLFQDISVKQKPYYIEGGLGNFVLTNKNVKKNIDRRPNEKAPKKSYYSKYRWIGETINEYGRISLDDLYDVIKETKPEPFLTPIRNRNATRYEPVKMSTFESYINGMQILGIIKEGEELALTAAGQKMFKRNLSNYNNILIDLIQHQFEKVNLTLGALELVIRFRMITRRIPTASEIYQDVRKRLNISMSSSWFSILLDLLSYTGYIRLTAQKTYYPYW